MFIDEKIIKELQEQEEIGKAMDKRKADLAKEKEELVKEMRMLQIRYMEIERELLEYQEEY